jgi:hypothetical protein
MECETRKWRAAVQGAAEGAILLVIFFVAGPVALAILDGVRLAVGMWDSPNVID